MATPGLTHRSPAPRSTWQVEVSEQDNTGDAPFLATAAEMVQDLSLAGIQFYELSVVYKDQVDEEREASINVEVNLSIRRRPDGLDFRARFEIPYPDGDVVCDAAVMYDAEGPRSFGEDAIFDFADNVAIMTLFPYVRQSVSDLGNRVGTPIVMPMLERGAFSFRSDGDDADSEAAPKPTD